MKCGYAWFGYLRAIFFTSSRTPSSNSVIVSMRARTLDSVGGRKTTAFREAYSRSVRPPGLPTGGSGGVTLMLRFSGITGLSLTVVYILLMLKGFLNNIRYLHGRHLQTLQHLLF